MDPKLFAPKYHQILTRSNQIDPKLLPKQRSAEIFKILREVFGPHYIILVSGNLFYNIQTKLKTTAIMLLGDTKVIVYQARPFAYPSLNKFEYYTEEDKKKYLEDAADNNVEEFRVVRNNFLEQADLDFITEYIKIYLNKNKDVKDYQAELMKSLKIMLLSKTGSLFLHMVLAETKTFHYQVPAELDLDAETKELKVEMKLGTDKKNYTLVVFEKQGRADDFMHRMLSKWRELCIFVFMFIIVGLLSVCRDDKGSFLGYNVEPVCRNKTSLMFTLGAAVVGFIIMKGLNKRTKRAQRKK